MSRCDSDEATKDGYEDDPVELPFLNSLSEAITCLGGICNFFEKQRLHIHNKGKQLECPLGLSGQTLLHTSNNADL